MAKRKLPPPRDGEAYDVRDVLGNTTPTGEKQGEWVDGKGGDAEMHAEMLGADDQHVTVLKLPTAKR